LSRCTSVAFGTLASFRAMQRHVRSWGEDRKRLGHDQGDANDPKQTSAPMQS